MKVEKSKPQSHKSTVILDQRQSERNATRETTKKGESQEKSATVYQFSLV